MKTRLYWLMSIALLQFVPGCADPPRYSDASVVVDEGDPEPEGEVLDDPACSPEVQAGPQGYFLDEQYPEIPPVLSGEFVYFHQTSTTPEGFRGDTEIVRFDPSTGERRQLTDNGVDDHVLDARGDAYLWLQETEEGSETCRLSYADASQTVFLESAISCGVRFALFERLPRKTHRLVEPGQAVWFNEGALRRFAQGQIETLAQSPGNLATLRLDGARASWSTRGEGGNQIHFWDGGQVTSLDAGESGNALPVVVGDEVMWISEGAVHRVAIDTGEEGLVHGGPCHIVSAAGGVAGLVCVRDGPETDYVGIGDVLYRYEGGELEEVDVEGAYIFDVKVHSGHLFWVGYEASETWCHSQEPGFINLRMEGGGGSVAMAPVGSDCYCCAMIPNPFQVSVTDEMFMWSHAISEETPNPVRGAVGFMSFGVESACR